MFLDNLLKRCDLVKDQTKASSARSEKQEVGGLDSDPNQFNTFIFRISFPDVSKHQRHTKCQQDEFRVTVTVSGL